ncbi:hexosaminidase D-like [Neocloeon triangulifer]|uniref:hexosaminidase D-like n=1 Tax=Neocloeon triangulifer TaxID=2078957 RepID=UPI00286F8066|nr:hexosaminidase D-like [Neocloeon triangulifer]XP_059468429.1 hexosaminidase D-like [Neocloeon triangulifer]
MMLYMRSRTRKVALVVVTFVALVYLTNIASVSNEIWKHPPWFARPNPQPPLHLQKPQQRVDDESGAFRSTERRKEVFENVNKLDENAKPNINLPPEYRVVHLDLKGAPPKISFLRVLFPLIASAGANAILIEYEDMFPFVNNLRNVSARNAYTRSDVQEINRLAAKSQLEVIPLVQTFGHLEFVLKLEEFAHFRESMDFPQEVCPNHPEVMTLIRDLIVQVRALHPESRYMHIGCDEVFHLALCARCSAKLRAAQAQQKEKNNVFASDPRFNIFASHVAKVAKLVRDELGMIPIIWDDMLRQQGPRLIGSELTNLVEPMVWVYTDDITRLVPHYVWHSYSSVFPNIWAASAFKGASGERALVPDIDRRIANTAAWLRILSGEEITGRKVRHFRGIVLTGWSRYDHFAVLCELLPASVPSLILALALVNSGASQVTDAVAQTSLTLLECGLDMRLHANEVPQLLTSESLALDPHQLNLGEMCAFPGANALAVMKQFAMIKQQVDELYWELTEKQGWLTPYNVRHGFSSPWRIAEGLAKQPFLLSNVEILRNSSQKVLSQYLDSSSVREWVEQRVQPLYLKLHGLQKDAQSLMARTHWPRRPLD